MRDENDFRSAEERSVLLLSSDGVFGSVGVRFASSGVEVSS